MPSTTEGAVEQGVEAEQAEDEEPEQHGHEHPAREARDQGTVDRLGDEDEHEGGGGQHLQDQLPQRNAVAGEEGGW